MATVAFEAPRRWSVRPPIAPLLIAGYAALLFIPGLGDRDLNASHEARAAQNAQMLLDDGDWLLPRLYDGRVELQKPPLYYWLVAGIAWLRGGVVDAWAVRLPSACAALGCVLWIYYLGVHCGRARAGLLAALVLASCVHFTWLARVGRIDMALTFALALALGCFEQARRSERRGTAWRWGAYTALALGVLLKGPIAVVLAALVGAVNYRAWRTWRQSSLWWGVPWLLLLTAPWFVLANQRTGGRLWEVFFWHHNFERGLGASETLSVHPWWYYLPRSAADLLPWSLLLPVALWCYRGRLTGDREARAGLAWFGAIFAFLSCMSFKRADYLLPAYPGFALALGAIMDGLGARSAGEGGRQPRRIRSALAGASGSLASLLTMYAACWLGYSACGAAQDETWSYQRLAQAIRQRTEGPVIFFRAEAHLLAFHVGRPLDTILEWENLEVWANMDFPVHVVMPADCAARWRQELDSGELVEVLRCDDAQRQRSLVVLCSRGRPKAGP